MTPETIRTIANLRREFYTLFAAEMQVPVKISGSSYNSSSLVASWTDQNQHLNYISIYAHQAPDRLGSQNPCILRLTINQGAGEISVARKSSSCRGLNRKWQFELTVLPEEILDFLPWIVSLAESSPQGLEEVEIDPPYPVIFNIPHESVAAKAWTHKAKQQVEQSYALVNA